jgi:hypothetical protein
VDSFGPLGLVGPGDKVIARVQEGELYYVPESWKLTDAQEVEVRMAQHIWAKITTERKNLDRLVPLMRESGLSWSRVGWCFGLTAEGARQRWGTDG